MDTEEFLSRYERGDRNFSNLNFSQLYVGDKTLPGCDFSNTTFDDCILAFADLSECNFAGAKIDRTNAIAARLIKSNLSGAYIGGAFGEADFFDADLSRAEIWANIGDCFLVGANLSSTRFMAPVFKAACFGKNLYRNTLFYMCDMSEVRVIMPSQIDLGTVSATAMINSLALHTVRKGVLRLDSDGLRRTEELTTLGISTTRRFFFDNGVDNRALDRIYGEVVSGSSPYQSVFISYASADEEFAMQLFASLRGSGVDAWFAPHDMRGGRTIITQIIEAIRKSERLILVLSEASIRSNWVATEILEARAAEKESGTLKLFPIRIVEIDMIRSWRLFDSDSGEDLARIVREYHIEDFSSWRDAMLMWAATTRLIRDLRKG